MKSETLDRIVKKLYEELEYEQATARLEASKMDFWNEIQHTRVAEGIKTAIIIITEELENGL